MFEKASLPFRRSGSVTPSQDRRGSRYSSHDAQSRPHSATPASPLAATATINTTTAHHDFETGGGGIDVGGITHHDPTSSSSPLASSLRPTFNENVLQHPLARMSEDLTSSSRHQSPLYDPARNQELHKSGSDASMPAQLESATTNSRHKKKLSAPVAFRRTSMGLGFGKSAHKARTRSAGSMRSLTLGDKERYATGNVGEDVSRSAFYVPIPTSGHPAEALIARFQAWRKVIKDLIEYFKEIQRSYDVRSKIMGSVGNVINNFTPTPTFMTNGGISEASEILRDFHRQGNIESSKSREVETEVVLQLTGLRNDLQQKLKEIKALTGDFRNNVEKEMDTTRKCVRQLQESLGLLDTDPSAVTGKGDPFLMRMAVDRQIERQLEEENYLHMAFLNLESSGRDLESIVVGEIQKAYNAYASILRRDAELSFNIAERLRNGPISLARDAEWNSFVERSDQLIDQNVPLRNVDNITYPGKDHPAAAEIRSGMLERKSKYLKSYTAGWYVLSPTHLHEFRSADKIVLQSPVMSLYLPDQKLGAHSSETSNSHKFMLKGRQTGSMHRGHAWVFRSESYDTMLAWYEDLKGLTDKKGQARLSQLQSNNGLQKSSDEDLPNNEGSRPGTGDGAENNRRSLTSPPAVNGNALDEEDEEEGEGEQGKGKATEDVRTESPTSPPRFAAPPPRAVGGFMKSSRAVSRPINFAAAHNPMAKPKPKAVSSLIPHQESPAEAQSQSPAMSDGSDGANVLATSGSSGGGDSLHLRNNNDNTDMGPGGSSFDTSGSSSTEPPPIRHDSGTHVPTYAPQPRKVSGPLPSLSPPPP